MQKFKTLKFKVKQKRFSKYAFPNIFMFPMPLKACITTSSNISDRRMDNFHFINQEKVGGFLKNQRIIPRIVRVHVCLIHPSIHPLILRLIYVQILTEESVW